MIPAFFGIDGRSTASHLAILIARVQAMRGRGTDLIRVIREGEGIRCTGLRIDDAVRVVEMELPEVSTSVALDLAISASLQDGRAVVLDLPGASLADPALAGRADVERFLPIGGSRLARRALGASLRISGGRAPWTLAGEGSTGNGPAIEPPTSPDAAAAATEPGPRAFPIALPRFTEGELDAIVFGHPGERAVLFAQTLLDHVRDIAPAGIGINSSSTAGRQDHRRLSDRLRNLSDALDLHEQGIMPSEAEMRAAPILNGWMPCRRKAVALAGTIEGHPTVRSGPAVTSEVFFSDGLTYARTLSRLYRLGRPFAEGRIQ